MTSPSTVPDPAQGPRLLFFTGGSALRGLSGHLVAHTHRSIHLVTTFDSGGSSAVLREAMDMPAVGDLRNRMLALAVPEGRDEKALVHLLGHRLPEAGHREALQRELRDLLRGAPTAVARLAHGCLDAAGTGFDLRHASVGNLVLAGAYLEEGRHLGRAVARFSALLPVRGEVHPVTEASRHLAARLDDGSVVAGQHRITRGAWAAEGRRIEELYLVGSPDDPTPVTAEAEPTALEAIVRADLVCYPPGSFRTSLQAALLPAGMGAAVAASTAPKVYVPNPPGDAEEAGSAWVERILVLAATLGAGPGTPLPVSRVLDTVLVDPAHAPDPQALAALEDLGVRCVTADLGAGGPAARYGDRLLTEALLSLSSAP